MCGILGGNKKDWNYSSAIEKIKHRGPDGKKIEYKSDFTLGFCRLAIQDLSDVAMQPMKDDSGKIHIVFNGEIYGYSTLKEELKQKYIFLSTSDTEVILYAYKEYGLSFLDKIDGIFSIGIYDERINKVYLIRDRAGVKPLYYYYNGDSFAFASELKALEELLKNEQLQINYEAVYDYLFYMYIPEPKSMYVNIFKLKPAQVLTYNIVTRKIENIEPYWKLVVNTNVGRKENAKHLAEKFKSEIEKSVKEQLISDVPIGSFLSGGIDSSIISYEINKINPILNAFSIGFTDKEFDESEMAGRFCQQKKIPHTYEKLQNKDVKNVKYMIKEWYDEPFGDTSCFPTYLLASLAKKKVTVALSGDGGDELFCGYPRYAKLYNRNPFDKIDVSNREFFPGLFSKETVEDYRIKWKIPDDYNPYWHFEEYLINDLPAVTRFKYLDFMTYLHEDILTKVDRTSMAVSLEVRVPFLSRRIIEFAFSLSQEECMPNGILKGIMKEAYSGIIPDEILNKRKMGFSIPPEYMWRERHEQNIYAGILKNSWKELVNA